jgi:hypothetical protein
MARKLAIANTVIVPIKFTLSNGGKAETFNFKLTCDRLEQSSIKATLEDDKALISEFIKTIAKGWEGQKLVIEDDGTPAAFDDESLAIMLETSGVASIIFTSYLKEISAKEKN